MLVPALLVRMTTTVAELVSVSVIVSMAVPMRMTLSVTMAARNVMKAKSHQQVDKQCTKSRDKHDQRVQPVIIFID